MWSICQPKLPNSLYGIGSFKMTVLSRFLYYCGFFIQLFINLKVDLYFSGSYLECQVYLAVFAFDRQIVSIWLGFKICILMFILYYLSTVCASGISKQVMMARASLASYGNALLREIFFDWPNPELLPGFKRGNP